jgi:hypothetical protein
LDDLCSSAGVDLIPLVSIFEVVHDVWLRQINQLAQIWDAIELRTVLYRVEANLYSPYIPYSPVAAHTASTFYLLEGSHLKTIQELEKYVKTLEPTCTEQIKKE